MEQKKTNGILRVQIKLLDIDKSAIFIGEKNKYLKNSEQEMLGSLNSKLKALLIECGYKSNKDKQQEKLLMNNMHC